MICGYFDAFGRPIVEAQVDIPSLNVSYKTSFILDTGATATCLHLRDVLGAEISFPELREKSAWASLGGVGGSWEYRRIPATAVFEDTETSDLVHYPIDLLVADATDDLMGDSRALEHALRLPSLLGRDIINHHDMTYSLRLNKLELHH